MGEQNTLEKSHSMKLLEEEANLRELISESVSENTLNMYHGALRRLGAFMGIEAGSEMDVDLLLEKLNDVALARYIAALEAEGKAPATAQMAIAAVSYVVKSKTQSPRLTGLRRR